MGPSVHPLSGQSAGGGGADEVPSRCGGTLRVGEVYDASHRLQTDRVVVHIYWREGDRVRLLIRRPRGGRLDNVKDL